MSTSWEGAPQGQDRPEIVASWARCLGRDSNFQQRSLPHAEYDDDSPLVRAARQPLSNLADEIEGLPGGIVVADDRGVIVASAPCSTTGRRALEGIEMVPGADFSERSVGTNGVGTALAAKRPVLVAAQEHLRPAFSEYICVGVPLTHPRTRQVMGVVELTTTLLDLQKANGLIRYTLDRVARRIERTVGALNAGSAMLLAELFDEREAKTVDPLVGVAPGAELMNAAYEFAFDARDRDAIHQRITHALRNAPVLPRRMTLPSGQHVELESTLLRGAAETDLAALVLVHSAQGATTARAGRPGRKIDRSRLGREHREEASLQLVDGTAPQWVRARHDVMSALERLEPVLVTGDIATGKTSLIVETFAKLARAEAVVLDPRDMARRSTARGGLASIYSESVGLVVLRGISEIPEEAVPRVARMIAERPKSVAIAATVVPRRLEAGHPAGRLLPLFHHTVAVPALAEHGEDIPAIVRRFLDVLAPGRRLEVEEGALAALTRARWPGNLRQLRDVLQIAVESVGEGNVIQLEHLPSSALWSSRRLGRIEVATRDEIVAALYRNGMNKRRAAEELGIARSTLYRKLEEYRLQA